MTKHLSSTLAAGAMLMLLTGAFSYEPPVGSYVQQAQSAGHAAADRACRAKGKMYNPSKRMCE
jgi:hypothetical protein